MKKHGTRYPWDAWFKRKNIILTRGVDFMGQVYAMAMMAYRAARKRGVKVTTKFDDNTITLRIQK